MPINTVDEYRALIARLVAQTVDGRVEWTKVNPSTFVWGNSKGNINIQVVERKRARLDPNKGIVHEAVQHHVLTAYDPDGMSQVKLDSSETPQFALELAELFDLAKEKFERKGLDFFSGLVG